MSGERLLLDEMFSPQLAHALLDDGFDVRAVAGDPLLAAASDVDVATWAARDGRRVLTENVRDYVPLVSTLEPPLRLLLTSSRRYPRSRRNPAPLLKALTDWFTAEADRGPIEWLP
jgi:hypothetical protein